MRPFLFQQEDIFGYAPARNHETPPARTTTATVSKPVSPVVVTVAVVLMVMLCLRLPYSVMVSSSKVPVAVC
ncbi:hypothetical protein EV356DRAFT_27612 [Viridothelium virens]|uniref:Uncharacterized protein n=1 Tax=Viridothelium virens TaxID=1048519 RepID=A0A6A6HH52_VIRVR|nr:hypothetical protein EV356DRAFT_27612 [Viridothelium virens]